MALTEEMFALVAERAGVPGEIPFGEHTLSFNAPFRRLSLREGARAAASKRLGRDVPAEALRSRDTAAALAAELHVAIEPSIGAGKIAAGIFEALCEDDLI